ncbi:MULTISPECIES: GNAT family N-acetyltransferase [Micromonospora]|uniref:N-acetyltransferase n=1 Tax=Micromonospora solifontis TaxID=2487138 RepID=A0ABX9WFV6_9ACTN|nr:MULTISPECIES: GNAT family N-acetyltransferase [Micromonospora]NES13839.1 GNAT family N-acetyltransferase [Micromonospora sp. PPF5-17B]NES37069.1 GNAT family N-acetyltransferase [Micromonospora solifontis]NES58330.1 GNAT family N-acetyltransferase [Micromonospora sp. PPF5-6]RNL98739.1 N-acetyltransferase [Micromonospora solifontis]
MFRPTYPIRTARLTLRPVTPDDLDDVYAYQRRPDVVRWMLAEPRTREQSRASVAAMAGEDALRAEGDCLTLAVAADAGVIGTVELVWRSQADRTAELGYVFHPDHGGRGLATEAAAALLDWGFGEFGLHRVQARCHGRNEPSARLMRRLGMRQEAHHVASYLFRGEWADQLVFAVLAHEWRSRTAAA